MEREVLCDNLVTLMLNFLPYNLCLCFIKIKKKNNQKLVKILKYFLYRGTLIQGKL